MLNVRMEISSLFPDFYVPIFFSNNISLFGHTCSPTECLLSSFAAPICIQVLDSQVSLADCVFIWKSPKTWGQGGVVVRMMLAVTDSNQTWICLDDAINSSQWPTPSWLTALSLQAETCTVNSTVSAVMEGNNSMYLYS